MSYHYIAIGTSALKFNIKCWWWHEAVGTLVLCWWKAKWYNILQNSTTVLDKAEDALNMPSSDPISPFFGFFSFFCHDSWLYLLFDAMTDRHHPLPCPTLTSLPGKKHHRRPESWAGGIGITKICPEACFPCNLWTDRFPWPVFQSNSAYSNALLGKGLAPPGLILWEIVKTVITAYWGCPDNRGLRTLLLLASSASPPSLLLSNISFLLHNCYQCWWI